MKSAMLGIPSLAKGSGWGGKKSKTMILNQMKGSIEPRLSAEKAEQPIWHDTCISFIVDIETWTSTV